MADLTQQQIAQSQEMVHMPAELPFEGTSLNPVETSWTFDPNAAAAPVEALPGAMQQGE